MTNSSPQTNETADRFAQTQSVRSAVNSFSPFLAARDVVQTQAARPSTHEHHSGRLSHERGGAGALNPNHVLLEGFAKSLRLQSQGLLHSVLFAVAAASCVLIAALAGAVFVLLKS